MSYLPDSYKVRSGPGVSAQPPAKKTTGLIEKETSLEPKINLVIVIYAILIVGAASSRDYTMIDIKRLFFAAGSRSHEQLM
jgi:hypothetical protein